MVGGSPLEASYNGLGSGSHSLQSKVLYYCNLCTPRIQKHYQMETILILFKVIQNFFGTIFCCFRNKFAFSLPYCKLNFTRLGNSILDKIQRCHCFYSTHTHTHTHIQPHTHTHINHKKSFCNFA